MSDFFLDTEPMSDHEKASIKPLTDQKEARVSRQMLCNHELEVFSEKAVAIFTETSCPAVWMQTWVCIVAFIHVDLQFIMKPIQPLPYE